MRQLIAIFLVAMSPLISTAADFKLGDKVFLKAGAEAKKDDGLVDAKFIPFPAIVEDIRDDTLWLGRAWVSNSDVMTVDESLEHFNGVIQNEPQNVNALRSRAAVFLAKRAYAQALEDCNTAIRLAPDDAKCFIERGNVNLELREVAKATEDFTTAIKLDPINPNGFIGRATAWVEDKEFEFKKGQNDAAYDLAFKDFEEAIKLDPENSLIYCIRGRAYAKAYEFLTAIKDYNRSIRLDDRHALPYCYRGFAWLAKGKLDGAFEGVNKAIKLNPQLGVAFRLRALFRNGSGDIDRAIEDLTEAIRINPQDMEAYQLRADIHCRDGEFELGITDMKALIRLNPKHFVAYTFIASIRATFPDERLRDGKEAVEYSTKANELTGWKDWTHLYILAAAYAEAGDFASAVKWQEKFVELVPEKLKKESQELLEEYRSQKPLRMTDMWNSYPKKPQKLKR